MVGLSLRIGNFDKLRLALVMNELGIETVMALTCASLR